MKKLIAAITFASVVITALGVCHYTTETVRYNQDDCSSNSPCSYWQYDPQYDICKYVSKDGDLENCISRKEDQICEFIIMGTCDEGKCRGGQATGQFHTNNVDVKASYESCKPKG